MVTLVTITPLRLREVFIKQEVMFDEPFGCVSENVCTSPDERSSCICVYVKCLRCKCVVLFDSVPFNKMNQKKCNQ